MYGKSACPVLRGTGAQPKVWLRYCGTAGKPGGKRRKQTSACSHGSPRSTRQTLRFGGHRIKMTCICKHESVTFHILRWQSSPIFPDVKRNLNARILQPEGTKISQRFWLEEEDSLMAKWPTNEDLEGNVKDLILLTWPFGWSWFRSKKLGGNYNRWLYLKEFGIRKNLKK